MAEPIEEWVCDVDGVPVTLNRREVLVHTDTLPPNTPDHTIFAVKRYERESRVPEFITVKDAARDMLAHHVVGHPESECKFAQNLREALDR